MTTDMVLQRSFRFGRRSENLPWFPRKGDRNYLAAVLGKLGFTTGVEVGTSLGRYAYTLCRAIPNLNLTCVDPWGMGIETDPIVLGKCDRTYARARRALRAYNVTFTRKKSMDAVEEFKDQTLDFVYIDGDHLFDFVVQDIVRWTPKVRLGGVIACHDYTSAVGNGVIWAVNSYTHCHHIDPWYVTRETVPSAFWVQR